MVSKWVITPLYPIPFTNHLLTSWGHPSTVYAYILLSKHSPKILWIKAGKTTKWWSKDALRLLFCPLKQDRPLLVVIGNMNPYKWPYKWVTGVINRYKWSYSPILVSVDGAHFKGMIFPSVDARKFVDCLNVPNQDIFRTHMLIQCHYS